MEGFDLKTTPFEAAGAIHRTQQYAELDGKAPHRPKPGGRTIHEE
jgi:hypothetical protein